MIAPLKEYWRKVREDAVEYWIDSDVVLNHLRVDLMCQVVIDWVSHVARLEEGRESLLVKFVIIKALYQHFEVPCRLIRIETNLEHLVSGLIILHNVLVFQDVIENLFNDGKTLVKHRV